MRRRTPSYGVVSTLKRRQVSTGEEVAFGYGGINSNLPTKLVKQKSNPKTYWSVLKGFLNNKKYHV